MENIISMGTLYLNGKPVDARTACPEDVQDIRLGDTVPGKELSFVLVNGLLVANNSVMLDVPFEVLRASHLVRARAVVIDGSNYRCRLLQTDEDENDADEWDRALIATGANRQLWNLYDNEPFWTVSPHGMEVRGGHGDPEGRYAWRPVLDPISLDFSRLKEGDYVQLGCGSNLISGFLEEATDYDLILDKNFSQISEVYLGDIEDFARKEKNGRWAVDKSAISVARTNNARGEEIIWLSAI